MPVRARYPPRPEFVGRQAERSRIREGLDQAATEGGVAVVISGEAGVGKTALARYALRGAEQRGFLSIEGGSNPLTRDVAYGPLVQALGTALRSFDQSERDGLLSELPALGALFVDLGMSPPEQLGDAALERTRLFEAVLRLVDRMSRRAPVAVLLDDLQWFDRASLELLAYMTRDLPGLPVLLTATYRSENTHADALTQLLQGLRRAGLAVEMELPTLTPSEVGELARRFLGKRVSEGVIDLLINRSAGVPLFAEAMINTWRSQGVLGEVGDQWVIMPDAELPAPAVAQQAIRERLRDLSEEERRLVELIAVGGGRVSWDVLSAAADDLDSTGSLVRLVDTGIVVERVGPALSYELAHPLMLEVAYEDVSAPSRRKLHARFAKLWEGRSPEDLDGLAFHFRAALPDTDPVRALEVSVAAGRKALDRYANAEAVTHLTAALELVGLGQERIEVLELGGEASFRVGDVDEAVSMWREALQALGDDSRRSARVHLLTARALSELISDQSDHHVRAGLAALDGNVGGDEEVELLYVAVVNAHRRGDLNQILERAQEVSAAAEKSGSERAHALATAALAMALLDNSRYRDAEAILLERGASLSRGGAELEMRGRLISAVIAAAQGDLPSLREANRKALTLVRQSGLPTAGVRLQLGLFVEAFYEGDWDRADEVASEARMMAEAIGHEPSKMLARLLGSVLHTFRGEFDRADSLIGSPEERAHTGHMPGPTPGLSVMAAAMTALERGEPGRALVETERMQARFAAGTLPPWGRVARAEALARLGHDEQALRETRELALLGPEGSYPDAMGRRVRGLIHASLGQHRRAMASLESAAAMFTDLGMPFEATRAGIEFAEEALRFGEPDDSLGTLVRDWLEIAVGLGAARYADRARRILQVIGQPVPADHTDTHLTPRQFEVAELVAQGLSNAEVAEALFISVRTVESHLDHIYTRLGFNSRVALATYVTAGHPIPRK